MTDLALNGLDLALPLAVVDGADAVRQALQIRLNFFQGEWFLDETIGIPYYQQIFGKKLRYGVAEIDAIFKAAILETPNVESLLSYSSVLGADRNLRVTFAVQVAGAALQLQSTLPAAGPALIYIVTGVH